MAGKGSFQRPTNYSKFSENYDKIFNKSSDTLDNRIIITDFTSFLKISNKLVYTNTNLPGIAVYNQIHHQPTTICTMGDLDSEYIEAICKYIELNPYELTKIDQLKSGDIIYVSLYGAYEYKLEKLWIKFDVSSVDL